MSSPICVKILKYQYFPKNFLLLCRQFFSIHNLEADNFFQPSTACEQFFYEKSNPPPPPPPPIKNNGPSLKKVNAFEMHLEHKLQSKRKINSF